MGHWKGANFKSENFEQKASSIIEVNVEKHCLDRNYDLEEHSGGEITPTGLLVIATLKPKKSSLPEFWFRWDEKDDKLDVDIKEVDNTVKDWFKRGEKGYGGHHPKRISVEKRTSEVDIRIPGINIFRGFISFGLHREVAIKDKIQLSDTLHI